MSKTFKRFMRGVRKTAKDASKIAKKLSKVTKIPIVGDILKVVPGVGLVASAASVVSNVKHAKALKKMVKLAQNRKIAKRIVNAQTRVLKDMGVAPNAVAIKAAMKDPIKSAIIVKEMAKAATAGKQIHPAGEPPKSNPAATHKDEVAKGTYKPSGITPKTHPKPQVMPAYQVIDEFPELEEEFYDEGQIVYDDDDNYDPEYDEAWDADDVDEIEDNAEEEF